MYHFLKITEASSCSRYYFLYIDITQRGLNVSNTLVQTSAIFKNYVDKFTNLKLY